MYLVLSKSKVKFKAFVRVILKFMLTDDIPLLYGSEKRAVIVQKDSAPTHRPATRTELFWKPMIMGIPVQNCMPYSLI